MTLAARAELRGTQLGAAIGRSVPRKEDSVLLTGQASFVDDLHSSDALHATILRSPLAHARIARLDVAAARALDGVVDVVTAGDLGGGGPPIPMRMFQRPGMERYLQRPLAGASVRFSGEAVAVVIARSRYLAEDAAELVEVEYEPLPFVGDLEHAVAADAPLLFPETGTNIASEFDISHGDIDAAFDEADLVVTETMRCGRQAATPLEPRGLLAFPDGDRLVVYGAAKVVHVNRRILASLLDVPEDAIRFVEPHVGGGFGARGEFYPEDYLIPFCALRLGRPITWTEDREESLRSLNHSRDQLDRIEIALRADGTFLALRAAIVANTGAYIRTHGGVVPGMSAGLLPGPYEWPAFACHVRQVVTNKTPSGTYRAPGRYEVTFARERVIDMAARRLGTDPVEIRRKNLVTPWQMPYANGSHTDGEPVVYDSGDYPLLVDRGLERFEWNGMRRWRDMPPGAPSIRRGIGIALFVEKSGIANWEYGRVELGETGHPVVYSGSASLGQGVETVLAQICADALQVPYETVTVRHGDTDEVPDGMGSFGSRATSLGGAAVAQAATALRETILDLAAEELEAAPEDLVIAADGVHVRGVSDPHVSFAQLAARAGSALVESARYETEQMSFPYGMHLAAVEVDVETGGVRIERYCVAYDVGRAINPQLVEGQIRGGLAQGLGGALLEELCYDTAGQLVSGSFMDYLMPTATEVPRVEVLISEDAPTQRSPIGAKGAGEGGTTAAGAALANAISDALGAEAVCLPVTPAWIVRAAV